MKHRHYFLIYFLVIALVSVSIWGLGELSVGLDCTSVSMNEGKGISQETIERCKELGMYDPTMTDRGFSGLPWFIVLVWTVIITPLSFILFILLVRNQIRNIRKTREQEFHTVDGRH